jgi:hypothetical protein
VEPGCRPPASGARIICASARAPATHALPAAQVHGYLYRKSWDTRTAAGEVLGHLARHFGHWTAEDLQRACDRQNGAGSGSAACAAAGISLESFNLQQVLDKGTALLGSAGQVRPRPLPPRCSGPWPGGATAAAWPSWQRQGAAPACPPHSPGPPPPYTPRLPAAAGVRRRGHQADARAAARRAQEAPAGRLGRRRRRAADGCGRADGRRRHRRRSGALQAAGRQARGQAGGRRAAGGHGGPERARAQQAAPQDQGAHAHGQHVIARVQPARGGSGGICRGPPRPPPDRPRRAARAGAAQGPRALGGC